MESHRQGDLTEQIVITELKKRGISVSTPVGDNERYDVVLEEPDGGLLRAQIKTGRLKDGVVRFTGVSQHTNSSGNVYKQYGDTIDCFLVHCSETDETYFIDSKNVGTSMYLRIDPPVQKSNQINWGEDYRLDRQWPPDDDDEDDRAVSAAIDALESAEGSVYVKTTGADSSRTLLFVDADGEAHQVRVETGWIVNGRVRFTTSESAEYYIVYCDDLENLLSVHTGEFNKSISFRVDSKDTPTPGSNPVDSYVFKSNWPPTATGTRSTDRTKELSQFMSRLKNDQIPHGRVEHHGERTVKVFCEDAAFRIRVESAWLESGLLRFNANGDNTDYYSFKNPETAEWYLVSDDSFGSSLSLRVDPPEKQDSRINSAEDYLLNESWPA